MAFFPGLALRTGAVFGGEGDEYRYELWRIWDASKPVMLYVMLNPSTAGESNNDPTIGRCIAFAKAFGYGGIRVINLFALRATRPREMFRHTDPIGPENDATIRREVIRVHDSGGAVCAAWGNPPGFPAFRDVSIKKRHVRVYEIIQDAGVPLHVLGMTDAKHPRHPLYVLGTSKLQLYGVQHA